MCLEKLQIEFGGKSMTEKMIKPRPEKNIELEQNS